MIAFRILPGLKPATALLPVLLVALITMPLTSAAAGGGAAAQQKAPVTDPDERMRLYGEHEAMIAESSFGNLPWQFIGPTNTSGRMTDIAVVEPRSEHSTIYVAGASGGVWKTSNEGTTWEAVFEHAASTSIGQVTVAPSNPDIVWVGTGEANIFRSSMAGSGIYKSTDAGASWTHMGLTATQTIARIIVHPANPDIVYVAASGHEWTDNPERGVYKTTDGGRVREKWNDPRNEPAYGESGIHRTNDGGETWEPINEGLPEGRYRGRIGIDIARSNPDVLYAFVDNYEIGREAPTHHDGARLGHLRLGVRPAPRRSQRRGHGLLHGPGAERLQRRRSELAPALGDAR